MTREYWWGRAALVGLACGVGFMLFGAAMIGIDVAGAHGIPREHAHVIRLFLTGERTDCGRTVFANANEEAAVFEVRDPRSGLPKTFEVRGCPGVYEVGYSDLVTRSGPTDTEVMIGPPDSGDVLPFAATVGGVAGVGALVFWLVVDGGRILWRRRHGVL